MNKIDLIIEALEPVMGADMLEARNIGIALTAARELRDMKPVAWWERDADAGNWFLTPSFNERAETEPLFYLGDADE